MSTESNFPQALLNARNLKSTSIRIKLLELIKAYKTAMPFSLIQKELKAADRITLYRTIQTLLDKGIIHKAFTSNEDTYYALCDNNCTAKNHSHNHVHFKCVSCSAVSCESLPQEVSIKLPEFKIDQVSIHLTGLCKRCHA